MGLKENLPLINSNSKGMRIAGYVLYGFVGLMVLGAILPSQPEVATVGDASRQTFEPSSVRSHSGFGNYTFDGQEDVKATVKKGTDIIHMMAMSELPTDYGYSKDGAQYTVTSTGNHLKGYLDYTGDGYGVVLQPRQSSMTKDEFMDVLGTFHRVE